MEPIRGQTRPVPAPVSAGIVPQKIDVGLNASIHNRFDIEVVDSRTGTVRQRAQAENVICTKFWSTSPFLTDNSLLLSYIYVGSGSGIPSFSDIALFNKLGSYSATQASPVVDTTNKTMSVKLTVTLSETTLIGSTITEIGCGSSSYIFTHAMLKDMNGNAISIAKTSTDIVNIYATIYLHWGDLNGFEIYEPSNRYYFFLAFMRLHNWGDYALSEMYNKLTAGAYSYSSTNYAKGTWSYDASTKKVTFTAKRIGANSCNLSGGISRMDLVNDYNYTGGFTTTLPASWYAGSDIVGEAIGTGDGITKAFATDFIHATNAAIYVNGAAQSGVTVTDASTVTNNIVFAAAPASGAVITADYHTSVIAKDVNHVFDFSLTIQLGEHTA